MKTRAMTLAAAGLTGLALLAGAKPGQAQVVPGDINKTQIRPSAHALGLGGSYLLLGSDPNGIITNPAAVGEARSSILGFDLAVEGQTSNVNINDINHLVDSLKNIRDQINNNNPTANTVSSVQGSFNDVYNFARNAGADGSKQARLSGDLSIGAAARLAKFGPVSVGTVGYDGLVADARLSTGTNNTVGQRTLTINGGALSLANVGIPVSYRLPGNGGIIGLTPKYVRADYAAFAGTASEPANSLAGAYYNEVNSSTFDLDAGYISPRLSVAAPMGAKPIAVQGALVVRHLASPTFGLTKTINNKSANFVDTAPGNFNFTLNPEVDLGAAASDYGVKFVAEVHNITSTNGGGDTFHVGAEYNAFKYIVPRIGYDNNAFVYGLGIDLGIFRLNAAASTNYQERAAADLSLNFGF